MVTNKAGIAPMIGQTAKPLVKQPVKKPAPLKGKKIKK